MTITKTTTTKTVFTISLNSITEHYVANMLEWLQNYSKDNLEGTVHELQQFARNAKALTRGMIDTIKQLFDGGSTFMLLSKEDFDIIEQAEIDKEKWEIHVVNEFGQTIVRIPGEDVGW